LFYYLSISAPQSSILERTIAHDRSPGNNKASEYGKTGSTYSEPVLKEAGFIRYRFQVLFSQTLTWIKAHLHDRIYGFLILLCSYRYLLVELDTA
jgi:hypothetical protein